MRFVRDRSAANFVPRWGGGRGAGQREGVGGGRYGAWKFLKNESGSRSRWRARARAGRVEFYMKYI